MLPATAVVAKAGPVAWGREGSGRGGASKAPSPGGYNEFRMPCPDANQICRVRKAKEDQGFGTARSHVHTPTCIFTRNLSEVWTWAEYLVFCVNKPCDESGMVVVPAGCSGSIDYASLFRSEITPLGSLATVNVTPVAK